MQWSVWRTVATPLINQETPYDAVLMDVRMAKVNGIEALERIKEINPAIPVIIMTAYSSWIRLWRP